MPARRTSPPVRLAVSRSSSRVAAATRASTSTSSRRCPPAAWSRATCAPRRRSDTCSSPCSHRHAAPLRPGGSRHSMSVHTLGNTSAPTYGDNNTSAYNEIGPTGWLTPPSGSYVSKLWGWFGSTSGGAMTAHLLLVGSGGSLIVDAGAQTVYGLAWQSAPITPHQFVGTNTIGVAWWVGAEVNFGVYSGGNWQGENVGGPSNLNGFEPGYPYLQGGTGYYLEYIDPLAVTGVSPSTAATGASVTISGSGFVGGAVTGVTFNGIAASFVVNSDTSITATVPGGYTTGTLVVTSDHGTGTTSFTEAAPTISSTSPTTAGVGQTVPNTGYGFTDGTVTSVTFTGVPSTYTVNSNTQITATVPAGATTGNITVNTNHGSASYAFTASGIWVYDGASWQQATLYVYDGSAWQVCTLYVYDGSAWQQTT